MGVVPTISFDQSHPLAAEPGFPQWFSRLQIEVRNECSYKREEPQPSQRLDTFLQWQQTQNELLALKENATEVAVRTTMNFLQKKTHDEQFNLLTKPLQKRVLYRTAVQMVTAGFMRDAERIAKHSSHPDEVKAFLNGGSLDKPHTISTDFNALKVYFVHIMGRQSGNFAPEQLERDYQAASGMSVDDLLKRVAIRATPKASRLLNAAI